MFNHAPLTKLYLVSNVFQIKDMGCTPLLPHTQKMKHKGILHRCSLMSLKSS